MKKKSNVVDSKDQLVARKRENQRAIDRERAKKIIGSRIGGSLNISGSGAQNFCEIRKKSTEKKTPENNGERVHTIFTASSAGIGKL